MRDRQVIHLEKSAGVRTARYQHGIHGLKDSTRGWDPSKRISPQIPHIQSATSGDVPG